MKGKGICQYCGRFADLVGDTLCDDCYDFLYPEEMSIDE